MTSQVLILGNIKIELKHSVTHRAHADSPRNTHRNIKTRTTIRNRALALVNGMDAVKATNSARVSGIGAVRSP